MQPAAQPIVQEFSKTSEAKIFGVHLSKGERIKMILRTRGI